MSTEFEEPALVTHVDNEKIAKPSRIGNLKLAFMYVLIGGLAASALIAIVALLIGTFNSEIQKSLLTILIFFSHSLFILGLLWADKFNEVGRKLLPTAIFVLTLANMISTTLSTWEIISAETAWRALGLYILAIGGIFIIIGTLKLLISHKPTRIGLYVTAGSIAVLLLAIAPWVLAVVKKFDPIYFRSISALAIFATTAFLIAIILRGIALAHRSELKNTKPVSSPIPGGLLAIYITVGTIAAMVWCGGLAAFVTSAMYSGQPESIDSYNKYY